MQARHDRDAARQNASDQALQEQLDLREAMLSAIPIPVFYKDLAGRYLGCNKAFCDFTQCTPEQIKGQRTEDLFPDYGPTYVDQDRRVREQGAPLIEPCCALDGLGRRRQVIMSKAPLPCPTGDGEPIGIAGAFLDFTDQKHAQDLLAHTGSLARIGGWKIDPGSSRIFWTQAMKDIHEVEDDYEPSLEGVLAFYPDEALKTVQEAIRLCEKQAEPFSYDAPLITAKGNRLWVRVRGEPIYQDGQCVEIVGAMQDITELKNAQLRLLEERELFTSGPVMVFRWEAGEDIPIEYASPSVRLLGYEPEDFTAGRLGLRQIVHPEDLERVELTPQKDPAGAGPSARSSEFRLIDSSGAVRWIIAYTYPHYDADGALLYADGYMLDVTERRKTEAELQRARRLDALGVLAGGIAHDFNNILTAILGNINLAKFEGTQQEEAEEILSEAETATLRAKELAQQLLTFSKGGTPVRRTEPVGPCIRETVSFCLRGSKIRAELEIAEDLWPARIDADQISQVLNNIVLNALQSMPSGGTLNVTAHNYTQDENYLPIPQGPYVKIALRDNGCGITQEHLDRIFDPYFTTKQAGSGLGLAVSYAIVQKHDGFLWAESTIGEGSTFHIALPAAVDAVVEKPPAGSERDELRPGKGRILVMDDDVMVARTVQRMLTSQGYSVVLTHDGAEALQAYEDAAKQDQRFDVVILDLTVPGGMGGAEAIRRLRQQDPEVKAIVSSGYSSDPVVANHRKHGFQAVASKPYDVRTIVRAVQCVLGDAQAPAV